MSSPGSGVAPIALLVVQLARMKEKPWRSLITRMHWQMESPNPPKLPKVLKPFQHLVDTPELWAEARAAVSRERRRLAYHAVTEAAAKRKYYKRVYMRSYMRAYRKGISDAGSS